ncbi:hypothetical protein [Phytobacter sp. AG2a]|jgi:hypothetical protein
MTFTSRVKHHAGQLLIKAGVPEQQIPSRMKSVGSYMILLSCAAIIPLVLLDNVPMAVTIILQLVYAALMCIGLTLAVDEKK